MNDSIKNALTMKALIEVDSLYVLEPAVYDIVSAFKKTGEAVSKNINIDFAASAQVL